MSSITVAFWGSLTIANVWMAAGNQVQSTVWIVIAVLAFLADAVIKMRS